jgi:hypothetical protein
MASDFWSPRTAALAGSGHAAPLLNDAIYMNPSFTSFLPTYAISGNIDWWNHEDINQSGKIWNASLQDGRSELFQAGVGFTHFSNGTLINIGASKAATQKLGFGLGGKTFIPSGNRSDHVGDMSFSTELVATPWLQVSFMADNLIQQELARQYGLYREFTIGTKFNLQNIFYVYFDPHYTPSVPSDRFGTNLGLEFPIFSDFYLRGGWYRGSRVPSLQQYGKGWGTGLGWVGPRISFDYAFARATEPMSDNEHILGTTIYF